MHSPMVELVVAVIGFGVITSPIKVSFDCRPATRILVRSAESGRKGKQESLVPPGMSPTSSYRHHLSETESRRSKSYNMRCRYARRLRSVAFGEDTCQRQTASTYKMTSGAECAMRHLIAPTVGMRRTGSAMATGESHVRVRRVRMQSREEGQREARNIPSNRSRLSAAVMTREPCLHLTCIAHGTLQSCTQETGAGIYVRMGTFHLLNSVGYGDVRRHDLPLHISTLLLVKQLMNGRLIWI